MDSAEAMTDHEFEDLRRSAFAIAYRTLGSVSEAEDVVQEGLLRSPGGATPPPASGSR
jgi:DNA-directed RNA polymerase specialized sigma24 family protein